MRGPSTAVSELCSCPTLPNPWPGACSDYLCHLKEVRREQYSQGRITSDVPAPLEIQAVRDLVRARGREMQAENLNAQVAAQVGTGLVRASCANRMMAYLTPACCLHLQVDAALSAGQLCQSLLTAFQQKQWQWTYLLRMAMTFMPATLGRSDDLRKLPWSCLALRTQDNVSPVPSVAILFGSMQGKTVKPGQVDIPGVVRYAHTCCQTQLGSVLQCLLSHNASPATGTGTIASVLRQRLPTWLSPPSTGASNLRIWPSSLLPPLACRGISP